MKILVCITHVPDTTSKISFIDNNSAFDKTGVQYIIGPYDDYALARAVELKESHEAEITVLNVGTAESEPSIRKALAIGADKAIRIDAEPTDPVFVAKQITAIAKKENYDLIMMGRESIDYNGGIVHGLVGEMLDIPSISPVMILDLDGTTAKMQKEIEGGKQIVEAALPLVLGCQEPIAEWKIPNMRGIMSARTKPLEVIPAEGSGASSEVKGYEMPAARTACKLVEAGNEEELVRLLKDEAKAL
ncbi:MAG: electron transfer flavoprotein beta subunit/FixA family protein [Cyclobacteriaceae bacterium]